ncbi:hypothetical protein WNZ15_23585 [Roseibium sp. AS2]|uniref:hypothetical protein n=1 Tax=Roseibium sp. AS2 TaxID=3135781 RepID=UPI0031811A25
MASEETSLITFSNISGDWTWNGEKIFVGPAPDGEGTLQSHSPDASVDIIYSEGDVFRLLTGHLMLHFGPADISGISAIAGTGGGSAGSSDRFLKLAKGRLLAVLQKSSAPRKVSYDLSTAETAMRINSNTELVLDAEPDLTTIFVLVGPVRIEKPVPGEGKLWPSLEIEAGELLTVTPNGPGNAASPPSDIKNVYLKELNSLSSR